MIAPASHKIARFVTEIKQSPCVQCIGVYNLESIDTRDAELRAQEVYRARLFGDLKFLVYSQLVVAALQNFAERQFVAPSYVLVDRLEDLDLA
jgi:hypothetical protein